MSVGNGLNRILAESALDGFKSQNFSLVFGKSPSDDVQKTEKRSTQDNQDLSGVVGVNLPKDETSSWFYLVTRNIPWVRGSIYESWDSTQNMDGKNYYTVVTSPSGVKRVYWCIDNDNGSLSTIPPTGTNSGVQRTEDGYVWAYLYTIAGEMSQFLTSQWLPVPTTEQIRSSNVSTGSPLNLARGVLDYWADNAGSVLRITLPPEMSRVRFTSIPEFEIIEIPENEARFDIQTEFFSNASNTSENGFKISDINVLSGGKEYTQTYNNLFFTAEPTFPENYTVDFIVGNDTVDGIQGPLMYLILSPQSIDFPTLLGASSAMIVYSVDSSRLAQVTDVADFTKVSLVKNLKNSDGANINETINPNTPFRMSHKITLDANYNLPNTSGINSATRNSLGKRASGRVVNSSSSSKNIEIVGDGKNFVANDIIFDVKDASPSTVVSRRTASISASGKHSSSSATFTGAATTVRQIANVNLGEGRLGNDTQVVHTQEVTTSDNVTRGQHAYQVRFLINGDATGRRSSSSNNFY